MVGKQHFFGKAECEAPNTTVDAFTGVCPFCQLAFHICIPHDWPGDQLREKADVHGKIDPAPLRSHIAPVHIDHIRKGLKSVE